MLKATTSTDTATRPDLRHRFPLYPSQFLGAMAVVSVGPLLDPMMRDLRVPLSQGGLIGGGLFVGNVLATAVPTLVYALFSLSIRARSGERRS